MRKNINLPEDELISEIANNRMTYNDFRSKYFHGESSRYRLAYNNLYDYGLITEDSNMIKLTNAGNDVYLYNDFKKYISHSKSGMKNLKESKTRDHWSKYFPPLVVIIVILGILITLTLNI